MTASPAWRFTAGACLARKLCAAKQRTYMPSTRNFALTVAALVTAAQSCGAAALTAEAARVAQTEFREKHRPRIEAQGWLFIVSGGILEWSDSDIFIQDIRRKEGSVRSAWVLASNYEFIKPWLNIRPPYQSIRALYWFDCSDYSYEYRQGAAYFNPDGTGLSSDETIIPTSEAPKFKESAPGSLQRILATTACK